MDRAEQYALVMQLGKERRKLRHEFVGICCVAERIPECLSRDRPVDNESPFDRSATIDSLNSNGFYAEGFQTTCIFNKTCGVRFEDCRSEKPFSAEKFDDQTFGGLKEP